MRIPYPLTIGCVFAVLASGGCYYDNEADLYPNSFCDTTNVTYATKVLPIIRSNCSTPLCHVPRGNGGGDFTTYAGLRAKVDDGSFATDVFRTKAMPPSSSLSACDLRVLRIWVDAGAPNN
ncbi:MAG: hypothetical protein QM724_06715 [Flavobacteriales bacterium]